MEKKLQSVEDVLQKTESKLLKIENEFQEYRSSQEQSQKEMFAVLRKLENQAALNLSELHNRNQEKVHTALHELDRNLRRVLQNQYNQPYATSCKDVPSLISGTYLIRVKSASTPFTVYCEQQQFGGGWIVFQYRYDGSLDFYRGWNEFRDGFGDLNKEFWLGLEKVHQLTSGRKHELIVELKNFNGTYIYARYDAFEIGNESDQYDVKNIGKYSGTAGDIMSHYEGVKFSTKDRDNDAYSNNYCLPLFEGAWWHKYCTLANLNGRYMNDDDRKSMHWGNYKQNRQKLSFSRMMIRELR
ncbi:fibrinogen-like protein A [Anopheles darlingi]|uniref:fibrinogen-like protein A n=1 Tax=Anopheles darlingi TaxID=43151 RepID=UPI00210029EC|nr:fibrinogen-like protein A [Anopheles darlingi]